MLLRGETNFFACNLRHYLVLIVNFSDIKRGYKNLNLRITSQVFSKKSKNYKIIRYKKNFSQLSYNSIETCDVKTRPKNN